MVGVGIDSHKLLVGAETELFNLSERNNFGFIILVKLREVSEVPCIIFIFLEQKMETFDRVSNKEFKLL